MTSKLLSGGSFALIGFAQVGHYSSAALSALGVQGFELADQLSENDATPVTEMSNKCTPTHDVWAVQRGTSDKGFWSIIGAGWQHEDGLDMSFKLNLLPIAGQDVVIPP